MSFSFKMWLRVDHLSKRQIRSDLLQLKTSMFFLVLRRKRDGTIRGLFINFINNNRTLNCLFILYTWLINISNIINLQFLNAIIYHVSPWPLPEWTCFLLLKPIFILFIYKRRTFFAHSNYFFGSLNDIPRDWILNVDEHFWLRLAKSL